VGSQFDAPSDPDPPHNDLDYFSEAASKIKGWGMKLHVSTIPTPRRDSLKCQITSGEGVTRRQAASRKSISLSMNPGATQWSYSPHGGEL
jgi:hypothetical protein